jgi:ADP-ribose pyrophosphatase
MQQRRLAKWTVHKSELAFDHPWAKVRCDIVELPSGKVLDDYYYWDGGHFVQVFAMTQKGDVLLVRQYKHGAGEIVLELPAGMIDESDEDPEAAARRELYEETGYRSNSWRSLGVLLPSSAKATTRAYAFLALDAYHAGDSHPDETEDIEIVHCSVVEFIELISRGSIHDSNSIAIAFLALTSSIHSGM